MNGVINTHLAPAFAAMQPSGIPVATADPTKVDQDMSLARMRKSYDEAQRQIQEASYGRMGQRLASFREGTVVDVLA